MKVLNFDVIGLKRTKPDFITSILEKSMSMHTFEEALQQLKIFKSIDLRGHKDTKLKLSVQEEKYRISAGTNVDLSRRFTPYLQLKLPNLLGRGESLNFLISAVKSLHVNLSIPLLNKNGFFNFIELNVSSYKRRNALAELQTKEYTLSYSSYHKYSLVYEVIENLTNMLYVRARNKQNESMSYDFKAGCFENRLFYKLTVLYKNVTALPLNFFHKLRMRAGVIHGHVHSSEKFFLGENIRGYSPMSISPLDMNEKVGGKSCIELSNALGYTFRRMKFFVFNDLGFSSRQNNLFETLKSSVLSLFLVHKPSCLGWSTGIGCTIDLHRYKNVATNVTVSYAVPLAETQTEQNFKFEIDFDIL